MAASGAISSVVGATSSLIGGGGSSPTQYVPNYESENMVNEAYMSFLSDSYDQQLELVNSQYSIDSDLTDVTYKMYVEQLAADKASSYDQLYNSYLQSLSQSYMTESNLEMQNLADIYELESKKLSANLEYQNTMDSISNARAGREAIGRLQAEEYESGLESSKRGIEDLRKGKELEDQSYNLQRADLGLAFDNLTENEKALLLQREGSRDQLTSELASINAGRSEAQSSLSQNVASIENQRQQLMNAFIQQNTQNVQAVAQLQAQQAAQGQQDTTGGIQQQQALDPNVQNQRLASEEMLRTQQGFAQNAYNRNMGQLDTQEALTQRGYQRGLESNDLQMRQAGLQRQGMENQAQQLGLQQQGSDQQYQSNLANLQDQQSSFINNYYGQRVTGQVLPEQEAQLAERAATQGQNFTQGSLEMSDLQRQYGYDVDKQVIGSSRELDAANFNSYYDLIGSNYDYNKQSTLAGYWSDLASNATNRAATVSGLGSSYSGQMSQLAASQRTTPQVSKSGGGGGFNFGGLGQALSSGIGLLSGNRGGTNNSNLYVTSDYGTYSSYDPSYATDWSGSSYSGFISGANF